MSSYLLLCSCLNIFTPEMHSSYSVFPQLTQFFYSFQRNHWVVLLPPVLTSQVWMASYRCKQELPLIVL